MLVALFSQASQTYHIRLAGFQAKDSGVANDEPGVDLSLSGTLGFAVIYRSRQSPFDSFQVFVFDLAPGSRQRTQPSTSVTPHGILPIYSARSSSAEMALRPSRYVWQAALS